MKKIEQKIKILGDFVISLLNNPKFIITMISIIISLILNLALIGWLYTFYAHKLLFVLKIGKSIIIILIIIYIIGTIVLSFIFDSYFKIKKMKTNIISFIIFLNLTFGSTLLTTIKSVINLVERESDLIFENQILKIYYLWHRTELNTRIDDIYKTLGGVKNTLTNEQKNLILDETFVKGENQYLIENLRKVIEVFVNKEQIQIGIENNDWYFQILMTLEQHPYIVLFTIIGGLISCATVFYYFEVYQNTEEFGCLLSLIISYMGDLYRQLKTEYVPFEKPRYSNPESYRMAFLYTLSRLFMDIRLYVAGGVAILIMLGILGYLIYKVINKVINNRSTKELFKKIIEYLRFRK